MKEKCCWLFWPPGNPSSILMKRRDATLVTSDCKQNEEALALSTGCIVYQVLRIHVFSWLFPFKGKLYLLFSSVVSTFRLIRWWGIADQNLEPRSDAQDHDEVLNEQHNTRCTRHGNMNSRLRNRTQREQANTRKSAAGTRCATEQARTEQHLWQLGSQSSCVRCGSRASNQRGGR